MDLQRAEWINVSDLPPLFRDEILGSATYVTKRYFRSAKGGQLDPVNVKLPMPFVVAITGTGQRGIGVSIALSYAQAGASGIFLSSRSEASAKSVAEQVKAINPSCRVEYEACDVSKEEDVIRLASRCRASFGRLDVAVFNQCEPLRYEKDTDGNPVSPSGICDELEEERMKAWATNYHGTYSAIKRLLPLIQQSTNGPQTMIILSSLAANYPYSTLGSPSYNMSKLALNRLAEYVDAEFKSDVVCIAVHPGAIKTNDETVPWDDGKFRDDLLLCL